MRVLWCSLLRTGSSHVVLAAAFAAALNRGGYDADLRLLHATHFQSLAERLGLDAHPVRVESAALLLGPRRTESLLLAEIARYHPDVLVVEGSWFVFHDLLDDIDARKIGLFSGMLPEFYRMNVEGRELRVREESYDRILLREPFDAPFSAQTLNPIVLRNPDEILTRAEAAHRLDIDPQMPTAFIALNGKPGEFNELERTYSYLEDEYQVVYSSNYHGGIFPAIDYYNAFDFLVLGGGYSQFWEAIYLDKDAVFVPQARRFESQAWRIENCQDYRFTENGADQLARIIA